MTNIIKCIASIILGGGIPVAADLYRSNLSKYIKKYLTSLDLTPEKVNEYFVILTQPIDKSLIFIEQEELLKIAIEIEKNTEIQKIIEDTEAKNLSEMLPENISKMLQEHKNKYYYTKHLWVEGEYTLEDYVRQLKDILNEKESAQEILDKQYQELEELKNKKELVLKELQLDEKWQNIFQSVGDFMITKVYRRYAQILAVHHMSPVLKEIAKRKYVSEKQVRFMLRDEVEKMLLEDKYDEQVLQKRTESCVYYAEKDGEKVVVGAEAEEFLSQVESSLDKDVDKIEGEVACVGQAKGKVKIIIRAEDMKKMEKGDVLVSVATDPDIVSAMKIASAIVTDAGGVTSHAAIVSRELNIPCVIGTRIATSVLEDGMEVEVDAVNGIVKKV